MHAVVHPLPSLSLSRRRRRGGIQTRRVAPAARYVELGLWVTPRVLGPAAIGCWYACREPC